VSLVKHKERDGKVVLIDKCKPERYLALGGEYFILHIQLGQFILMVETSAKKRAATRKEREASRDRHPAA
jgi:hypothetical protein